MNIEYFKIEGREIIACNSDYSLPVTPIIYTDVAVEADRLSNKLYFRIEKEFDGVTWALSNIKIRFVNSEKYAGVADAVSVSEDSTYFTFYWLLDEIATMSAGTLDFVISVEIDANNYRWQTKPYRLTVEQGLLLDTRSFDEIYAETFFDTIGNIRVQMGQNVYPQVEEGLIVLPEAEPALGNPATSGYVLSSTNEGVRSWVAAPTGGGVTSVNTRTGAVTLSASDVGLGNVTNESKATMFTNAALTDTPTAPTAAIDTNSTQIATTAGLLAQIYKVVGITSGGTTNYTATIAGIASLVTGQIITLRINAANVSTAPTLNLNSIGVKTIKKNGAALAAGDLGLNAFVTLGYDGTAWQILAATNLVGAGTGGGTFGSSTFNSTTGRTITHNVGSTTFAVSITPAAATSGTLGEIYYTKTSSNFTVYNTGSFTGAFDYILVK